MIRKIFIAFLLLNSFVFSAEVTCQTIQDSIKKIRCKYMSLSEKVSRNVTFKWTSPDNPADNRAKSHIVPAGYISVFDYRYFSGRAEGTWIVEVYEENNSSVSTKYLKDSNAEVTIGQPQDPLKK